jgi:hypothetical protein
VDVDVSRYNTAQADPALQERVLEWRQAMNAVVPRAKQKPKVDRKP